MKDLVLAELGRHPGQRTTELAVVLGTDRQAIIRCLADELAGLVHQAPDYRWRLVAASAPEPQAVGAGSASELARLCRYYLECIGHDMDQGVSAFARVSVGEPGYAELPSLPMATGETNWFRSPTVGHLLGKVSRDRANLVAWMGYPLRLRRHRTPKWVGLMIEPILLWRIEIGQGSDAPPKVVDEAPVINPRFLRSVAMGDVQALALETARLSEALGLHVTHAERHEVEDLIERLVRLRPDWDWQEAMRPAHCHSDVALAALSDEGIYNRAVVMPGERTLYTQGLETELKFLSNVADSDLRDTALGGWLAGGYGSTPAAVGNDPLIEVVPMNLEQRAAVMCALTGAHTVVTGPPGTGKSQVVTNLLVNAAWRGLKVLFASKNNKAVDVVEARLNGLANRPVLLRLGARDYQAKLAGHLVQSLAGNPGTEDHEHYEENVRRHFQLVERLAEIDRSQERTLDARNAVDRLDADADGARQRFGRLLAPIDEQLAARAGTDLDRLARAIDSADLQGKGLIARSIGIFLAAARSRGLRRTVASIGQSAAALGIALPANPDRNNLADVRGVIQEWRDRLEAARKVLAFQRAMEVLERSEPFEDIARRRASVTAEISRNSQSLWRYWVQLAPTRLAASQRRDVADYAAALQIVTGADERRVHASVRERARALQGKVVELFNAWAVTSLSANGRVPLEPGYFDLVVIDEASQCDIASALPLLYRAKRSVIIGDPQQLKHITAVSPSRDSELQHRHGLVDTRLGWMYSVSSLYDVALGVVSPSNLVALRDHHRSHADIITFANRYFYQNKLRVATRYDDLKRPGNGKLGVLWRDVRGKAIRPSTGSVRNHVEAQAVISALEDMLLESPFEGTVGLVTPFRAQAQLLQQMVNASDALQGATDKVRLLVDTVHRFQGDERDVMIFSPVVSEGMPEAALSFLRNNGNLFNVAITRARGLLLVVGDRAAAATCGVDYLAHFASYVDALDGTAERAGEAGAAPTGPEYPAVSNPERVSDWERVLFRAMHAAGIRAIPQFTVEQYDLDFAVIVGARRLNIEVDGERFHRVWTGELCLRDQLRNQRLIELGWEVKRFWVYQLRDSLDRCVAEIVRWTEQARSDP